MTSDRSSGAVEAVGTTLLLSLLFLTMLALAATDSTRTDGVRVVSCVLRISVSFHVAVTGASGEEPTVHGGVRT